MGSRNAKPPSEPSPGRRHGLLAMYKWPGSNDRMTVGEAIPRQMKTVGCTWDEAAAFVGIPYRTLQDWLYDAAKVHRGVAAGRDLKDLSPTEAALYALIVGIDQAAAEVTVRWQGILEQEGRGGYEMTRKTVVERTDAEGKLIERREEIVTEKARPDVKAVIWKMEKQLKRYRRDERVIVFMGPNGVELPEPSDEDAASEVAESIRRYQVRPREAIEATSREGNGHG